MMMANGEMRRQPEHLEELSIDDAIYFEREVFWPAINWLARYDFLEDAEPDDSVEKAIVKRHAKGLYSFRLSAACWLDYEEGGSYVDALRICHGYVEVGYCERGQDEWLLLTEGMIDVMLNMTEGSKPTDISEEERQGMNAWRVTRLEFQDDPDEAVERREWYELRDIDKDLVWSGDVDIDVKSSEDEGVEILGNASDEICSTMTWGHASMAAFALRALGCRSSTALRSFIQSEHS